jgi:Domain of unknown function (DUF4126)
MDVNVFSGLGTSYGLALASGVNAYVPLLVLLWLNPGRIPSQYAWVENPGFLVGLTVLAALDFFLDKIPVLDTFWDSIHTAIRPVMGALVAAVGMSVYAPTPTIELPHSGIILASISSSTVVIPLLGGAVAGAGHTTKAVGRLAVAIGAFGCFNTIISIIEDAVMVMVVLLSFFDPMIMLGIVAFLVVLFLLFSPIIFEAWKYNMRVVSSLFTSIVLPSVFLSSGKNTTNVVLSLSEEQRERLYTILPPTRTPRASVRLLWLRRLNKKGPWGRRRIAPPTWLIILQDTFLFYPPSRPEMSEEIDVTHVKISKFKKSIFMGLLQILTRDGRVYTFAVPKDVLAETIDCIRDYFPPNLGPEGPGDPKRDSPIYI